MDVENKESNNTTLWHTLDQESTFNQLTSTVEGLTTTEAEKRFSKYGSNRLKPPKKKTGSLMWLKFLSREQGNGLMIQPHLLKKSLWKIYRHPLLNEE